MPNFKSCNYGIIKHKNAHGDYYAIHELYYADDGSISYTKNPIQLIEDRIEDLEKTLKLIIKDVKKNKLSVVDEKGNFIHAQAKTV